MLKFPNAEEIKAYQKVIVTTREPLHEYTLNGKPVKAYAHLAGKEIIIETENGYYQFDWDNVLSVQFFK